MINRLASIGALIIAAVALLLVLDIWLDDRFVRKFQEREQMTVRPSPRWRPEKRYPWGAGRPPAG